MGSIFSLSNLITETRALIERQLWAKIVAFLLLGVAVGYGLGPEVGLVSPPTALLIAEWLSLPGKVFLILMQMIVIPLVMTSVILGVINSGSVEKLKLISIRLVPYFVLTTSMAIIVGFSMATLIKPGVGMNRTAEQQQTVTVEPFKQTSVTETLTSILPKNPLGSMMDHNLFQIVIFAIIIGVALLSLESDQAQPIVSLMQSVQKLTMIIVGWAMYIAPIAVFGLMAELLAQVGLEALRGIGAYAVTVLISLLIIMVFYGVLVSTLGGANPFRFFKHARNIQLLAFSTSSSAAVMPLTIETAEKHMKVSPSVSRFVIPLGTTINMDGTATYQGVAAVFIAQAYGLDLSMGQIGLIVVSATGASIGAPGTPGVGMAILASLLTGIGIPAEGIMLIMGIDRLLDMARTAVNVTGDLAAAVVFDRFAKR